VVEFEALESVVEKVAWLLGGMLGWLGSRKALGWGKLEGGGP